MMTVVAGAEVLVAGVGFRAALGDIDVQLRLDEESRDDLCKIEV